MVLGLEAPPDHGDVLADGTHARHVTMPAMATLRELLAGPEPVLAPGAYDALSARLVERAGFPAVYMTGFGASASLLGRPDVGLLSFDEMADHARRLAQAVERAGDRRRRRRLRQPAQRDAHGARVRRGRRRRAAHRGPGRAEALRPHGGQGGDRRGRDGREGARRGRGARRRRAADHRPHRRARGRGPRQRARARAALPRGGRRRAVRRGAGDGAARSRRSPPPSRTCRSCSTGSTAARRRSSRSTASASSASRS